MGRVCACVRKAWAFIVGKRVQRAAASLGSGNAIDGHRQVVLVADEDVAVSQWAKASEYQRLVVRKGKAKSAGCTRKRRRREEKEHEGAFTYVDSVSMQMVGFSESLGASSLARLARDRM